MGGFALDPEELILPFFKRLNGDVTLRGATYLNGTGKIYKGPAPPVLAIKPTLAIQIVAPGPVNPNHGVSLVEVAVVVELPKKDNGAADYPRFGRIMYRTDLLLRDYQLNAEAAGLQVHFCDSLRVVTTAEGPFLDPAAPDWHYGRIVVEALMGAKALKA